MNAFTRDKMLPVRALCALLIVAGHLAIPVGARYLQPFLEPAACSVAIFLFISGYGLSKSYEAKGNDYLRHFFSRRIWKVLWPALVALILFYILIPDPSRSYLHDLYLTFRRGSPPLAQLWYVIEIFCLYLLFWLSFRFLPDRYRIIALWLGALLFMGVTFSLGYTRNWWIHTLAFPTGVTYAHTENTVLSWMNKRRLNPWLTLTGLSFLFVLLYLTGNPYVWTLCYVVLPLICALVVSLLPLERIRDPFMRFIGTVSYEIYLFHGIAIAALRGKKIYIDSDGWYIAAVFGMTFIMAGLFLLAQRVFARH
jgi:peptidoglycan/LPS O-acetylase OafA/YrhL